jgi:CubicO group peptidase (beta-lactamase class C family)
MMSVGTAIRGTLCAVVVLAVGSGRSVAQALPDTPQGTLVGAFLLALNSGDAAALERFVAERWSPNAPRKLAPAERAAALRGWRDELGTLVVQRVEKASPEEVMVVAAGAGERFYRIGFRIEPATVPRLLGIKVDAIDAEDASAPPPPPMTVAQAVEVMRETARAATAADEFSGSVLVARHGAILLREAYGLASREHAVANRPDTRFNLGSINKLFTKVAIAQLAAAGTLSLDDTIGRWLPDYPSAAAREKVTLRHLTGMSGGIGDFFGERFAATPKDRFRTNRDFLPMFAADPLQFEPGSQRRYSNGGFVVLGEVIARASGADYHDYVRSRIFVPTGMTGTDSYEADAIVPNLAEGYTRHWDDERREGTLHANIYSRPARGSAAGGGYSTVDDLLAFTKALVADTLLPPAWTEWVLGGPEPTAGAAPAATAHTRGGIGAAGGAPGINAALDLEVATGEVVVVLANLDPPAAERLSSRVRRLLAAAQPAP